VEHLSGDGRAPGRWTKNRASFALPLAVALLASLLSSCATGPLAVHDLVILPATVPDGEVGVPYPAITVSVVGYTGSVHWTFFDCAHTNSYNNNMFLPGVQLDRNTGAISGTPTTAGTYQIGLEARIVGNLATPDRVGFICYNPVKINPPGTLVITSAPFPDAVAGSHYSAPVLKSTGGVQPVSWDIPGNPLPPGLSLGPLSGVVSGIPTTLGMYTFTVRATDVAVPSPHTATRDFTVNVTKTLAVATSGLDGAAVGRSYAQPLQASGNVGTVSWSILAGSLGTDLMLDASTGVITGTPTATGTKNFTVQVADSALVGPPAITTATKDLSILVVDALSISTTSPLPNTQGSEPYSQTLQATGGLLPLTWTLPSTSPPLPSWLSLSPTGVLSGNPAGPGTFSFTAQVTDSLQQPQTDARPFQITVDPSGGGGSLRVSVDTPGSQGNGNSQNAAVSFSGQYVAFDSVASNLDSNHRPGIFVRDTCAGQAAPCAFSTVLVSLDALGQPLGGFNSNPSLSSDAMLVTFEHQPDSFTASQILLHYRGLPANTTTLTAGNDSSFAPVLSADGRYVAYASDATNLVGAADTNSSTDIFVTETCLNAASIVCLNPPAKTVRVSVVSNGTEANQSSGAHAISGNGRFVVFTSMATNLASQTVPAGTRQIYLHDRDTDGNGVFDELGNTSTVLVSLSTNGNVGNQDSAFPATSADGRFIAFSSLADNLLDGDPIPDTNGQADVFLRDTCIGAPFTIPACAPRTIRVSLQVSQTTGESAGDPTVAGPISVSSDGRLIVFPSAAADMVIGDTNGKQDIFVHDTCIHAPAGCQPSTQRASPIAGKGSEANNASFSPVISGGGDFLAFDSSATNLVLVDTNQASDVFMTATPLTTNQLPITVLSVQSFTFAPNPVTGGLNTVGTVTLNTAAPTGGIDIPLVSINTAVVTVPASVHIDEGATSGAFTATTSAVSSVFIVPVNADLGANGKQAQLTVNPAGTIAPVITQNPTDLTVTAGSNASFTAAATGNPTPTVQWQMNTIGNATFTNLLGATSTTLAFAATAGQNGNQYRAVFTNTVSSATTTAATLTVTAAAIAPPTISKAFGAASVRVLGTTTLTFTINNPNTSALTGIGFTDPLVPGLVVATPNGLSSTCGGTATAVAGSGSISLSGGGSVAASASCTLSVNVTGTTAGVKANTTGAITSTESGPGATSNTVNLTVVAPPTISKAFGVASVQVGVPTTLTFTINNPNATVTLAGVGFTDILPAGLAVGTPNGLSNTCAGTPTAFPGGGSVVLMTGTLAAGGSCTIVVNVTAISVGAKPNTTGTITSTEGGPGTTSNTATLTAVAPPTISKAFGIGSVLVGGTTTLTFTINNPNAGMPLTGIAFTDTLAAGLVVATPGGLSNTCGGTATAGDGTGSISLSGGALAASGSCTIAVNVTGATAGVKSNTTSALSSTEFGTGATSNTVTLAVLTSTALTCPLPFLGQENFLHSNFTFLFDGWDDVNGPYQAAGVFATDGAGNVISDSTFKLGINGLSGELDYGTAQASVAPVHQTINPIGSCYNLGSDRRGFLILNVGSTASPTLLTFSINLLKNSSSGRMIRYEDDPTGSGTRGTGFFEAQPGTTPPAGPSGSLALSITGYSPNTANNDYLRSGTIGRFDVSGTSLANGFADIAVTNTDISGNSIGTQSNFDNVAMATTSTFTAQDAFGRGTLTINFASYPPPSGSPLTLTFAYYNIRPQSAVASFVLQSLDPPDSNGHSLSNGRMMVASTGFDATGTSTFFASGADLSTSHGFTVTAAGMTNIPFLFGTRTAFLDKISNGSPVFTNQAFSGISQVAFTSSAAATGMGTITLTPPPASGLPTQTFSGVSSGNGVTFLLEGTQASPGQNLVMGEMLAQTAPAGGFGNATITGPFPYATGTFYPASTKSDVEAGAVTASGGTPPPPMTPPPAGLTGNRNRSLGLGCSSNCLPRDESVTAQYSIDANGRITFNFGSGVVPGWLFGTTDGLILDPSVNGTIGFFLQGLIP
jgi:hypothetical protein